MANFEFDLEMAELELKCVSNLLSIYQEFFCDEVPSEGARGNDAKLNAQIFADRAHEFHSLIDAAQDKIIAMRKKSNGSY